MANLSPDPYLDLRARLQIYSPKAGEVIKAHACLHTAALDFGNVILDKCPHPTREVSLALTNLEQVLFWANAAIDRRMGE